MSLRIARYVIAICDRCGPGWWAKDPACGAVTPHFLSELCAREQLAADYGWVIRHRLLRDPVMTCRSCSRQAPAQQDGWLDRIEQWLARLLGADEPAEAQPAEAAACRMPPPSHPETGGGAVLTAEQEELLAELDASLFPDDPTAWP